MRRSTEIGNLNGAIAVRCRLYDFKMNNTVTVLFLRTGFKIAIRLSYQTSDFMMDLLVL